MSTCPRCGAATTPGAGFCGSCGQSLAAPSAAPADPSPAEVTQVRPGPPPAQPQWAPPPQHQAPQHQAPQHQAPQHQAPPQPGQPAWGQQPPPAQQSPAQQQWGQPQYAAPGAGYGAPSKPSFDFSAILGGNWLGMATVVAGALGVALIVNAIIAFTTAEDLDVASAIALTLLLVGATFGANIIYSMGESDFDQTASLGQYPLLATVLALGVAIYLFRRSTARYSDIKVALLDAVRAGVMMMLSLLVLAIALRIWHPELEGYASEGDGINVGPAGLGAQDGETHLSFAGAIFLGFLLLFAVLALTCFVRGDWLQGVWAKVYSWVASPLIGIAAVAAAATLAGLVYLIAIVAGNDEARGFADVMALVAVLPALGIRMLALGVFANVGYGTSGDEELIGDDEKSLDRLPDFADDNGALFWISPLIAIAVAVVGVYTVIWKSVDRTKIQRNVLVYLGLLLVAVPFLVRFANAHLSYKVEADDETFKGGMWMGVSGFGTTGLFFLLSIVVALLLLVVTGNLDLNAVKAKAQSAAQQAQAQMQQNQQQPQQWGQPQPPQQQWGQPQPPQQQWGPPPQQQWGQQPPAQGQPPQPPQQWGPPPPQG